MRLWPGGQGPWASLLTLHDLWPLPWWPQPHPPQACPLPTSKLLTLTLEPPLSAASLGPLLRAAHPPCGGRVLNVGSPTPPAAPGLPRSANPRPFPDLLKHKSVGGGTCAVQAPRTAQADIHHLIFQVTRELPASPKKSSGSPCCCPVRLTPSCHSLWGRSPPEILNLAPARAATRDPEYHTQTWPFLWPLLSPSLGGSQVREQRSRLPRSSSSTCTAHPHTCSRSKYCCRGICSP